MPAASGIRVEELRELQRAFALADKATQSKLRGSLRDVAEPVRADAERLAIQSIPQGRIPWSDMRVGVTRSSVYVAPKRRRTVGTPRRNFAAILMGRAMQPALAANEGRIADDFDQVLTDVANLWGRA